MRYQNILFCICVGVINILIVISLFVGIYHHVHRKAICIPINPTQPMIMLTFDDEPNSYYIPQALDVLYEQQVLATFFLTGEKSCGNEPLLKEMVSSGHEIGSHTFSDPNITTLKQQQVQQEISHSRSSEESSLSLILWMTDKRNEENSDTENIYTTVVNNKKWKYYCFL